MPRLLRAFLLATAALVMFGITAEAHALARSSSPPAQSTLDHAPSSVTITFTERPDPKLSSIYVLDASGRHVEQGPAQAVPGDPLTLSVPLGNLPNGVYTVTWKTVSAVDSHVAGGYFPFGVGVSPAGAVSPGLVTPTTPPPSVLGTASRWFYYIGVALLVGGTWVAVFGFGRSSQGLLGLITVGGVAAFLGLAGVAESQRSTADVSWSTFFVSSLGSQLAFQAVPILVVLVTLIAAWATRGLVRDRVLTAVGALTLLALLTHVMTSHAPSSDLAWLMVPAQWLHVTAFSVWLGGLAALLVGSRGLPTEAKARTVRRFSRVAGYAILTVAVTGALRAIDEVGALDRLISTLFGQLVVVKVGLLGILALLGATNRYRNVPVVAKSLAGLRRVGGGELSVAAVVLVVAALLTSLAPPSYSKALAASTPRIVAEGHDFGTTVKVRLEISPGYPGSNRFDASIADYDSGAALQATRVALSFAFPARPDVGESTLELKRQGETYTGMGSNLSLIGRWTITMTVERGIDSVEVPLTVNTTPQPEQIHVQAGNPTLYTVDLVGGRSVQFYIDPGTAGHNVVHATYFDSKGAELPVADGFAITGNPAEGSPVALALIRFDAGHFAGQGALTAGTWRFDVSATGTDGTPLSAYFSQVIKP